MKKKNYIIMGLCVFLVGIVLGISVYYIYSEINSIPSSEVNTTNTETKDELEDITKSEPGVPEYVGTYYGIDEDGNNLDDVYITLNKDGTYERTQNDCSATTVLVGEYSTEGKASIATITLSSGKSKESNDIKVQESLVLKYKKKTLHILNDEDEEVKFDCSKAVSFKKR